MLFNQLDEIEKHIITHPDCDTTLQKYNKIKQKLESIIISETEGARIRSGQQWAEEGEKCTKFFLNLEKHRSKTNTIFKLHSKKQTISLQQLTVFYQNYLAILAHFINIMNKTHPLVLPTIIYF